MRIALYVESDEDGPGVKELLLTAYVDRDDQEVRLANYEQCDWSSTPSRVAEFLAEVLGSVGPTAGP